MPNLPVNPSLVDTSEGRGTIIRGLRLELDLLVENKAPGLKVLSEGVCLLEVVPDKHDHGRYERGRYRLDHHPFRSEEIPLLPGRDVRWLRWLASYRKSCRSSLHRLLDDL